jgi:hypothetical protein
MRLILQVYMSISATDPHLKSHGEGMVYFLKKRARIVHGELDGCHLSKVHIKTCYLAIRLPVLSFDLNCHNSLVENIKNRKQVANLGLEVYVCVCERQRERERVWERRILRGREKVESNGISGIPGDG